MIKRRRSGAQHAQTCEEYLQVSIAMAYFQKYDNPDFVVERTRKSSSHEPTISGFDFNLFDRDVYETIDKLQCPQPLDKKDDPIKLSTLIFSPYLQITKELFIMLLSSGSPILPPQPP